MINARWTPSSKGQLKCYRCRDAIRSKDGSWHDFEQKQVFFCKDCLRAAAARVSNRLIALAAALPTP